jgi:hypothetical protein
MLQTWLPLGIITWSGIVVYFATDMASIGDYVVYQYIPIIYMAPIGSHTMRVLRVRIGFSVKLARGLVKFTKAN